MLQTSRRIYANTFSLTRIIPGKNSVSFFGSGCVKGLFANWWCSCVQSARGVCLDSGHSIGVSFLHKTNTFYLQNIGRHVVIVVL